MARIQIIDSTREIRRRILFELAPQVDAAFKKAGPKITTQVKALLRERLLTSETMISLLSGKLKADFGLTNQRASSAAIEIVEAVVSQMHTGYNKTKHGADNLTWSIYVHLTPSIDYVLQRVSDGSYLSRGGDVDWLEWLLTRGSEIVIGDFQVEYGRFSFFRSRSGEAIMVEGDSFRVDPEFAGTIEDNFITRTIQGASEEIAAVFTNNIKAVL